MMFTVGFKDYLLSLLSPFWELFIFSLVSSEVSKIFFSTRLGYRTSIIPFFHFPRHSFLPLSSISLFRSLHFRTMSRPHHSVSANAHCVRTSPVLFPFLRPLGGTTRCPEGSLLALQHCIGVFWKNLIIEKSIEINSN